MSAKTSAEVLRKAEELLVTARLGLESLLGADPRRRPSGIHNVAVFGRSTTLVLQNLRSAVERETFEVWYGPHVDRMKADPLFRYFVELRNEILKEGPPTLSTTVRVGYLDSAMVAELRQQEPPGARLMFIGDALGGSGFEVPMPDGSVEKYYVSLPEEWDVSVTLHLPRPPLTIDGKPMPDSSIEALCRLYVDALSEIVADARQTFG